MTEMKPSEINVSNELAVLSFQLLSCMNDISWHVIALQCPQLLQLS